jgi:hypothetical protein
MPRGTGESESPDVEPELTRTMSFLRGPAVPRVRPVALGNAYIVSRGSRNRVVLTRSGADEEITELASSNRRAGVDWPALAKAILADALDDRPTLRLTEDYARFIVTPRAGVRTISGHEIQAWLDTWRPGLSALFTSGR